MCAHDVTPSSEDVVHMFMLVFIKIIDKYYADSPMLQVLIYILRSDFE